MSRQIEVDYFKNSAIISHIMMSYEHEGIVITETREEGVTIQDEIRAKYGRKVGIWPLKSIQTPDIPTPDLRFECVASVYLSEDEQHVVATAYDQEEWYLVKDDKVLLRASGPITLKADDFDKFLSYLFATTITDQGRALHYFNQDGNNSVILKNQDRIIPHKLGDKHIYVSNSQDGQTFVLVDPHGGAILHRFDIQDVDIENIRFESSLLTVIWDEPVIVWKEYPERDSSKTLSETPYNLFVNHELVAQRVLAHEFNDEFSDYLLIRESEEEGQIDIMRKGNLLDRLALKPNGDIYSGPLRANNNLSLAAIGFTDGTHKWLYCITPKWHGLLKDHPFDKDQTWEFDIVARDLIVCTGRRNGVERELTIELDTKGTPQISEEAAA